MAWQQKRAHAGSTGVNAVFTQTVAHSPRVYTRNLGMVCAMTLAVWKQLRKCVTLMHWSCLCAVTRGRPDRGLSLSLPVVWKRLQGELMVFRCTPNWRATSCCGVPAWIIPMARSRASVPKRGMLSARTDIDHQEKYVFFWTSKHSQHPCMLTRCLELVWPRQRIRNGLFTTIVKRGSGSQKLTWNWLQIVWVYQGNNIVKFGWKGISEKKNATFCRAQFLFPSVYLHAFDPFCPVLFAHIRQKTTPYLMTCWQWFGFVLAMYILA